MKKIQPLILLLGLAFSSGLWGQNVDFENVNTVNEERLDFSPVPYGNGLMYTSSKSDRFLKCPSDNAGDYTDLFYAEKKDDGSYAEPVMLKGGINGKYNDGVPTFSPTGDKMIFTRNNLGGQNAQGVIDLKLYSADLVDGKWENVTALPFNSDDWSTAHPALSPDGTLLIFSSNRPGSTDGSMDIWGSRLENGVWSIPFNLGPEVNSDKNELFPFIDSDGNLFFSSNRDGGIGGLDIYAAQAPDTGDEWQLVNGTGNIGAPFNSSSDEVAFVPLAGAAEGYMASDRGGSEAEGMDDIYYWTREPDLLDATIQVVDKNTGKPLPMSSLVIKPTVFNNSSYETYGPVLDMLYAGDGAEIVTKTLDVTTDDQGMFSIRVYPNSQYGIDASKDGYDPNSVNPNTDQLRENEVYKIPLTRQYATLTVCVVEEGTENPISMAKVTVKNLTTGEEVVLETPTDGCTSVQIDCNDEYDITVSKGACGEKKIPLKDYAQECATGNVKRVVAMPKEKEVILEPIFYDFDRYYIRSRDAKPTLDKLVEILNQYPNLNIRLDGHTDSRGKSSYNDRLSDNRAKSAMKYLVDKGVDPARLSTKQYGEDSPVNKCTDEVYCPESDHQLNRRVDVVPIGEVECTIFKTRDIKSMNVVSDR